MTKVTDDCFAVFVCLIIRDEIIWSFCLLGLNVRKFAEIPTAEHLAGIFALGTHQFGNAAVPHRGERMVLHGAFIQRNSVDKQLSVRNFPTVYRKRRTEKGIR